MNQNISMDSKSLTENNQLGKEKMGFKNTPSLIIQQARKSLYKNNVKMTPFNKLKLQKSMKIK